MTVKQLLIGALLGATAVGAMLHRLPRNARMTKSEIKPTAKVPVTPMHSHRPASQPIG